MLSRHLLKCSLVSIPANPNALAVAKSMKISADTMDLVFAKHGEKRPLVNRSGNTGEHAETPPVKKVNRTMSNESIAQRVKDAEQRKVSLRDKLTEHMKTVDDENPTEEQIEMTDELTAQIEAADRSISRSRKLRRQWPSRPRRR